MRRALLRSLEIGLTSEFLYYKKLGAYGVRYLFVICGFSIAEAENLQGRFLLGRAPEADPLEHF